MVKDEFQVFQFALKKDRPSASQPHLVRHGGLAEVLRQRRSTSLTLQSTWTSPLVLVIVLGLVLISSTGYCIFLYCSRLNSAEDVSAGRIDGLESGLTIQGARVKYFGLQLSEVARREDYSRGRLDDLTHQMRMENLVIEGLSNRIARLERESAKGLTHIDPEKSERVASQTTPSDQGLYQFDPSIPLIANAVVHIANGRADYWLVKRDGSAEPSRVIPYAYTEYGVAVHCLDDGRQYLLSSDGRWKAFW